MIAIALALGAGETIDAAPDTERTIAVVELDGSLFPAAKLLRAQGAFWIERVLGRRERFEAFDAAMAALEHVAKVYDGKVRVR